MYRMIAGNFFKCFYRKDNYQDIFKAWIKLKNRKSYLSAENLLKFGDVFLQNNMYANAEEIYQHLLKYQMYSEFWPEVLKQLGRIQFRMGRYGECLESIRRLDLEKEPEISEFNYYRLRCYRHRRREEDAVKLLNSEAVNFTEITDLFQYRLSQQKALRVEEEKKYDEALQIYQQMLLFSEAPEADQGRMMVSVADLYYRLKDLESSLSYYRLAEKYNANMEWILYRIASIYKELNMTPEAAAEQEKLKKLNPNSFWLKQLEKNA